MASSLTGVQRTPALAGILLFFMLVASLSPVLQTEVLALNKSQYASVRSTTSNIVDIQTWMIGDTWIFETSIDVTPALAGTDLDDPGVNIDPLAGDTTHMINDIREEDVNGFNTLIYEMSGYAHYEGDIFIPDYIAADLVEGIPSWLVPDIDGRLIADYTITRWVRVSDLATIYQTQTADVVVNNIPILGSYDVGLITLDETYYPPVEKYDFPLDVGNNWWMNYTTAVIWSGQSSTFPLPDPATYDYYDKFEITQIGDPSVPYGCADSIRIQQVNMTSGEERGFEWYCDEVRYFSWFHGDILLGMVQDLRLKTYNPTMRGANTIFDVELPFAAFPPGFTADVTIDSVGSGNADGELRFEYDGLYEGFTLDLDSGNPAEVSVPIGHVQDDSPTEYDIGTHGLVAWDGAERLGATTVIIDPNAEGIDLVARSSGVIIERERGDEILVMNSVTGYSAQRGDMLSVSLPVQNRGISPSIATTLEVNGPEGPEEFDIPSLVAYQEHRVILGWEVPDDQPYGYVLFNFLADPDDINSEVDESNNAGSTPLIRIGASPLPEAQPIQAIYTFENVTIDGSGSSDPDGGDVECEFIIETVDGLGNIWQQTRSSDDCMLTYFWSDDGEYMVTMHVIDDEGDVGILPLVVDVMNQAPFIEIWADHTQIQIGESFTVNAENSGDVDSITPPDVADIEVSWPGSSCVEGAYKLNCTVTPDMEGAWTVTAVATDDDGAETTATVIVDVLNIMPNVIEIEATVDGTPLVADDRQFWEVAEDEDVELHGMGADSLNDIDSLHWTWSSLNMADSSVAWQREDTGESSDIEVIWTESGEYTIQANVLDDDLARSPEVTRWIKVVNLAPVTSDINPPEAIGEGMPITLIGNANDTASDVPTLVRCWDIDPALNSDENGSSDDDCDYEGDELTRSWGAAGEYTIIYHATDDDGARGTSEVIVKVLNQAPLARIEASSERIYVGESVTFNASGSSDSPEDKESLTYLWDIDTTVDSNGDGIPDNDIDHQGNTFTANFQETGTFTILLTVRDEEGCESSRCTQEIMIVVDSRAGGAFAQVIDNAGLSWGSLALIGVLFSLLLILVLTRHGREKPAKSMQENWDAQSLGAATNMGMMPSAAPTTATFSHSGGDLHDATDEGPPIPEYGLPPGWTLDQWKYYGAAWLEQRQNEPVTVEPTSPAVPAPMIESNTLLSEIDDAMNVLNDSPIEQPASNILDMFDDDDDDDLDI